MKRRLALLALLALPALTWAACSRVLQAPVAPLGQVIIVNGQTVSGLYPDLLRNLGEKSGCQIRFSAVPRARQEALFESGKSDLLITAARTPRRDKTGYFVPLIGVRAAMISFDTNRPAIKSMTEIAERKEIRVVLVRGFDYGENYQALARTLAKQGRVFYEADVVGVARLLNAGFADVTIMTPATMAGGMMQDERVRPLIDRLRIELLDDLPWSESGIYISRTTVRATDRVQLEHMIIGAVKAGAFWEGLKKLYPPHAVDGTLRQH
jgi:polar amino acid transport system substrate-binding protein